MEKLTADEIIIIEAIKISTREVIDGDYHFAGMDKVRAAAAGVTWDGFNTALLKLWINGRVTPHWGNPGKFENKKDLFSHDGDHYCSVSTTLH